MNNRKHLVLIRVVYIHTACLLFLDKIDFKKSFHILHKKVENQNEKLMVYVYSV